MQKYSAKNPRNIMQKIAQYRLAKLKNLRLRKIERKKLTLRIKKIKNNFFPIRRFDIKILNELKQ
ncbi:hypothetical protein BpHYR1_029246 [Brachionus plicatilis]|uniref:Uncharacterized protein n=1 Tax=Brachionus plicatilis TaxID=10195 RepID=A0A3M7PYE5_BRAPC|nr:hypothetical protein BpHYR1_029246 [Brachionus plicatilis]